MNLSYKLLYNSAGTCKLFSVQFYSYNKWWVTVLQFLKQQQKNLMFY